MTKPAIVVTGASSGIGRELARVAARDGSFMVLVDLSHTALGEIAAEVTAAGVGALPLAIDLREPNAGQHIEDALAERDLHCDVLVNSAGFGVYGLAAESSRAEQTGLIDVNARALTDLTLRFLPGMIARGRGGVINVGSITSYVPGPRMAAYFASKAYVRSFTAALAAEVAGTGVTVTDFAAGIVRTPFFEHCNVGATRLFKVMPHSNAPETAAAGWRGFKAGKRFVMPRLINRVIMRACLLVPPGLMLRFIARLMRPI